MSYEQSNIELKVWSPLKSRVIFQIQQWLSSWNRCSDAKGEEDRCTKPGYRNDNISAFLSHLLEVIWESRLAALFSARYDLASPRPEIPASVHDSFAPCGPLGALQMHALLIKRFVEEFGAYATWKLMITSHAAEHSTEKPPLAFYERFSPIYKHSLITTMFPPHTV